MSSNSKPLAEPAITPSWQGGLFTFLMIAWHRSVQPEVKYADAYLDGTLVVMWFTWLLSSLFAFWGRVRTAVTILIIFGGVWLLFNLLGNAARGGFLATLMQSLLAMPFFLAALLARYWPRVAGVLLLVAAVYFFGLFWRAESHCWGERIPRRSGRTSLCIHSCGRNFSGNRAANCSASSSRPCIRYASSR